MTPITSVQTKSYKNLSVKDICNQVLERKNLTSDIDFNFGTYFKSFVSFRGNFTSKEIDEELKIAKEKNKSCFTEWIPT